MPASDDKIILLSTPQGIFEFRRGDYIYHLCDEQTITLLVCLQSSQNKFAPASRHSFAYDTVQEMFSAVVYMRAQMEQITETSA